MLNTIAPFWDGNETWLVIIGASLFAAFPAVYAVFLGAFYFPVLLMLFGLIFRGIAFEFRQRTEHMRWLWDWGFSIGSTVVAFVQGAAIGAMMRGIPVVNGHFAGHTYDWVHPFPILTGVGLVLGYALLGAGWIVYKSEGALRDWAYARIPWLVIAVFVVLGLAFTAAMTLDAGAVAQSNLRARSWGFAFPVIGVAALIGVIVGARARLDSVPFFLTTLFFVAAYLTLGVMFWPYMVPYSVTVANAAAPDAVSGILLLWRRDRAAHDPDLHDGRLSRVRRQASSWLQLDSIREPVPGYSSASQRADVSTDARRRRPKPRLTCR